VEQEGQQQQEADVQRSARPVLESGLKAEVTSWKT
jgi:hypothetical protein